MLDALKNKLIKKEKDIEEVPTHKILYATTETGTVHLLKCPEIQDNPLRIGTIEDRHFFFCPICGQRLIDGDFVDVVEEKKRREEEANAIYTFG